MPDANFTSSTRYSSNAFIADQRSERRSFPQYRGNGPHVSAQRSQLTIHERRTEIAATRWSRAEGKLEHAAIGLSVRRGARDGGLSIIIQRVSRMRVCV